MHPVVHPAVAYVLYRLGRGSVRAGPPGPNVTLALVLGAIIPDVIDQPMYHVFAFPTTRTIAHSLLVAVPVCLLVWIAVRRRGVRDEIALGFAVGYLSHLAADALWPLVLGEYDELGFLLWPITEMPPYEGVKPLVTIDSLTITTLWVEVGLLVIGVLVWSRDGWPGMEVASQALDALREMTR